MNFRKLFSFPNRSTSIASKIFMILQLPRWLPAGKIGLNETPARDRECAHLDPTHSGGPCNCWVFTPGPSPMNAAFGCLHLDPARLQSPHFSTYISSTMVKYRRLQWVFTFRPSPAATFNIINVAMQIKKAKVLKVKVWPWWLFISLVISCKLSVLTEQCCEHELNSLKDLNTK